MNAKVAEVLQSLSFEAKATHDDVERVLRARGWVPCGAGDWAIALQSPDGALAARISPFDPMGPYTADFYAQAADTDMVPTLFIHQRLYGGGDLQIMEFLHPVPEQVAKDFLARLANNAPELAELRGILYAVHARAMAQLPYCGPHDENPDNVMMTSAGVIKLADPYYAEGPTLYRDAAEDPSGFASRIPKEQRMFLTEIPLNSTGGWDPEGKQKILAGLAAADNAADKSGGHQAGAASRLEVPQPSLPPAAP